MLKHTTKRFFLNTFASYGAFWTILESLSAFEEKLKPTGLIAYSVLVCLAVAFGMWQAYPSRQVEFRIPNSDSHIGIEFGDIFDKNGCIAIQVNEYFDSLLGNHVSTNTLHGMFIRDVLGGQSSAFDTLIQKALAGIPFDVVARNSGNNHKYRIGTTAPIEINNRKYFLYAFAKTNIDTLKAYATVHELWDALSGLWDAIRIHSNGDPIFVPLLGTGQSGVGLHERQVLELLILSIVYHSKKNKIAGKIIIVLHENLRKTIDLKSIKIGEE